MFLLVSLAPSLVSCKYGTMQITGSPERVSGRLSGPFALHENFWTC